ncbi:MAG TPA: FAD-dependent oxidoreductase [Lysobacter sp.]
MDLKSGYPYWAIRNGLMHAFPPLQGNLRCEVAVVGGGITGALIADELARHDHQVVVLERCDIAWGSTSASTALLQYEIDTHLRDLAKRYGEANAVLAYRHCADAIGGLAAAAKAVGAVDFKAMDSLYFANRRRHVADLHDEFFLRLRHGFDVEWLDERDLHRKHGLHAPAAILSRPAACIDPYRMAYKLFARLHRQGVPVHDRSEVTGLDVVRGAVTLRVGCGSSVRAQHVILAAGYASQRWLKQDVARNRSSYAFVTDPLDAELLDGLARIQVWETARPYLYLRSTGDHRLLVGGEDDAIDIPARRDARVLGKSRRLVKQVARRFPRLQLEPVYAWGGTFAETIDGLPFFGPHPQYGPRVHFAMAYGGNGITYSMLGAGLLRARIERRKHPLATLFSFDRLRTSR